MTSYTVLVWSVSCETSRVNVRPRAAVWLYTSYKVLVWSVSCETSRVNVRPRAVKCVVWNEPSECEAESSGVCHVKRAEWMWGREQWCGCTTSYTVLIVMSCKHGGLKWWSGVIQDWLLAAVVQVFVNCRFGGNRQHWTFLLEMLSLLPEEVRPHIVIVVVVVVVKSWWCGVIISGCHVLVSWCHIVM